MRRFFALLAVVSLLAACSGGTPSATAGGPISATLKEWEIKLSSTALASGAITFNITNNGDKQHEFVIRKTELQSDSLPLNADGEIVEDSPDLSPVGDPSEVAEIDSGTTDRTITVTLQPGHYVIFCNLHVNELLHYQKGMHVDFTVT